MVTEPLRIFARVRVTWGGSRVFMTRTAVKRCWRSQQRGPEGAAERIASDIADAIIGEGGTEHHVDRVLLACMTTHLWV